MVVGRPILGVGYYQNDLKLVYGGKGIIGDRGS